MRSFALIAIVTLAPALLPAGGNKLTWEDRVELTRGLTAEYATVKVLLPRSKKALEFESKGDYDKKQWTEIARESGPAARTGDLVQVTKIEIEDDKIVLQINGGFKGGRKWYQGVQIGMGGNTAPVSTNNDSNAPGGTSIAILFHKPLEPIKAQEIKKLLAPVLDFEKRSVTQVYSESLPPETQKAIKEKRVLVGMDREQVVMTLGRPEHKSRETKDGLEVEDWVYGTPPGKITFVTFSGDKVIKVKDSYAGLGQPGGRSGGRPVDATRHRAILLAAAVWILTGCSEPAKQAEACRERRGPGRQNHPVLHHGSATRARGEKALVCYGVENARTVWLSPPRQELSAALSRCVEVSPEADTTYTSDRGRRGRQERHPRAEDRGGRGPAEDRQCDGERGRSQARATW